MLTEKTVTRMILILTGLGMILRTYQIDFQCYWTEEQYTLMMANLPFTEILSRSIFTDCNPPVFYLLAHASLILSGFSDIAIRYPSLICGVLMIPAMYLLGFMYKNEMTGLYCAGFTTVMFPLVYYSQFGRAYAMSLLFFVMALIMYIRIRDGDHSFGSKTIFGILAALNIWTHLFAIIPVGLMMADLILTNGRKMMRSTVILGLLCLPLVQMAVSFVQGRITSNSSSGTGQGFGMNLTQILVMTPYEFFSTLFPYFGILTVIAWKQDPSPIAKRLLIIAFATIGIGVTCSFFTPVFPRYYLTVSLIFILLSAVACADFTEMFETNTQKLTVFSAVLIFMVMMQNGSFIAHYTTQKYVC